MRNRWISFLMLLGAAVLFGTVPFTEGFAYSGGLYAIPDTSHSDRYSESVQSEPSEPYSHSLTGAKPQSAGSTVNPGMIPPGSGSPASTAKGPFSGRFGIATVVGLVATVILASAAAGFLALRRRPARNAAPAALVLGMQRPNVSASSNLQKDKPETRRRAA